jgi:uncharacterized protein (TIGR03382 family)
MRSWIALPVLAILGLPQPASAHGGEAGPLQVVVDPQDSQHLALRATWGLARSDDAGATWRWVCLTGLGPDDLDLAEAWTDRWLIATRHGIATSPDQGCTWQFAPLSVGMDAVGLTVAATTPNHAYAFAKPSGTEPFRLFHTQDGGQTWAPSGKPLPTALHVQAMVESPSDPKRLYVSGWGDPNAVVLRTDDAGETWVPLPLEVQLGQTVLAVDPVTSSRVYVKSASANDQTLRVSDDAGNTWKPLWKVEGVIDNAALSPDGKSIVALVDAAQEGIAGRWLGSSQGNDFTRIAAHAGRCLTWTSAGLYACGDEASDGYTVAVSHDAGSTFQPLLHAAQLEPLSCPAGSMAAEQCPTLWPEVALEIGADPTPTSPGADVQGSDASDATWAEGVPVALDAGISPVATKPSRGCGATPTGSGLAMASLLLVVAGLLRRRCSGASARDDAPLTW